MNKDSITIGIDKQDSTYFVARVDNHTGRPDIKALVRFDADHFNGHHLLEGNQIVISYPDDMTMIKYLQLQSSDNADLKIRFELETALVESPDNFLFDIIPTKLDNYYIGLTIRKELAKQLIEPFIKQNGNLNFTSGGVMRSAALARGFLTYCQQSGGNFGAIIDFGDKSASIAFFYKQQIVDLTGLPLPHSYKEDSNLFQKVAIELKTLLNFKLGALAEKGITIPLSKLFVLGELLTGNQLESLKNTLKIEIARPEIHSGFIRETMNNNDIPLDKYLVALGLTIV